MSVLKEELVAYGVDIDDVMKRFVDDEDFYKECLEMFLRDDTIDTLKENIDKADPKEAFNAAHTLKGIVGNLGLTPLFDKISLLVEELRAGNMDKAQSRYAVIKEEYLKVAELNK